MLLTLFCLSTLPYTHHYYLTLTPQNNEDPVWSYLIFQVSFNQCSHGSTVVFYHFLSKLTFSLCTILKQSNMQLLQVDEVLFVQNGECVVLHYADYKTILSPQKGINLYRGCTHGCIYCDSRSTCYQMNYDFEDIEPKIC